MLFMADSLKQGISIGKNLKHLRKQAHLTQEQAAAQLQTKGLSISADILAKMEQGRYSIRLSVLLEMERIYQVKAFDEFFEGLE